MPAEPFSADQVIVRCKALQDSDSFQELRHVLQNRHDLLHRFTAIEIAGISERLDWHDPALEVHANLYANHIDKAELIVDVAARDEDRVEEAQDIENFLYQYYFDLRAKRSGGSYGADRRALFQQAAYLAGIRHLRFSSKIKDMLFGKSLTTVEDLRKALGDIVEKGFQENPFVIECPDLRATFWEPNQSAVCEVGKQKIATIYAENDDIDFSKEGWAVLTSDTVADDDDEYSDMADVYHLETSDYIYDVVATGKDTNGEAVMLEFLPNVAGRPWYSFAPGNTTSDSAVVEMWSPLIGQLYPVIAQLNIMRTLAASGALITGRPQYQEVANSGAAKSFVEYMNTPTNQKPQIRIDLTEEMIRQPRDGFHWEVFPVPNQTAVNDVIATLETNKIEYGFPQVLSPGAASTATSGYDRSRQMEPAINQLTPPLTNHADAWLEIFQLTLDIQRELNVPITIPVRKRAEGEAKNVKTLVTLKPSRLSDYDLTIRFRSVPAAQAFADEEADNRKLELGLISKTTWMARRYDDPVAEAARIKNDKFSELADAKAFELAAQLLEEHAPNIASQVLAEEGIPQGANAPRPARPAGGGAQPSLGAPGEAELAQGQRQPGDFAPPNVVSEQVGAAQ